MSVSIDIILNKGLGYFSYKDEYNLNSMRPTPHLSLEYKEINTLRTFQCSKFNQLTRSVERNKLYCYMHVLFKEENKWRVNGIPSIKYFVCIAETIVRNPMTSNRLSSLSALGIEK